MLLKIVTTNVCGLTTPSYLASNLFGKILATQSMFLPYSIWQKKITDEVSLHKTYVLLILLILSDFKW